MKGKSGTQFYNCEAEEESRMVLPGEREERGMWRQMLVMVVAQH